MRIQTLAGTRTLGGELPRSTAYYYADLERLKRKNGHEPSQEGQNPDELSEYVDTNEVVNDGAVREVPPLRDRGRQWSLPEYNSPENSRKIEETYSTAGTFPMPEPKEKEPLLAELEVVGRLPLSQLESTSGVRRSRSWYLCCPNVADEEISRESSWRYSSLRPVTAPPVPGHNGVTMMVASHSSGREDVASLRAERDALARALAAERQRAATAARAHDARLAELHGVIAELVRRRAHDKHARAIPEEEVSDECESTTQPAGELDHEPDHEPDHSRTEQNDTSSALSPELPTPQESKVENTLPASTFEELPSDTETSTQEQHRAEAPRVELTTPSAGERCDTSANLSERDSDVCLSTARCWSGPGGSGAGDSCERERGSPDEPRLYSSSTGRCTSREAKLAARVRLRRTDDSDSDNHHNDDVWKVRDMSAHVELEDQHGDCEWAVRCARLQAERRVLQCALARATDNAHRLYCACAVQESTSVSLCCALRAADRALETYDVLLALAETALQQSDERTAAEQVAGQLLARLDTEQPPTVGEPLLSPGPWLQYHPFISGGSPWTPECEARLREHAARLKADTVSLRELQPGPRLFSFHDVDEDTLTARGGECELCGGVVGGRGSAAEMEAAVAAQEALNNLILNNNNNEHKSGSSRRRRTRARHWLDSQATETEL